MNPNPKPETRNPGTRNPGTRQEWNDRLIARINDLADFTDRVAVRLIGKDDFAVDAWHTLQVRGAKPTPRANLNPTPYALHPASCTLHPKPLILNSKP